MSTIIHTRNQLNYWIECKEAFVLQRLFRSISDQNLFPIMILLHFDKQDKFIHQEIKYYLIEYDLNNCHSEEMLEYLQHIGFLHICYSKDDLPIFLFINNNQII